MPLARVCLVPRHLVLFASCLLAGALCVGVASSSQQGRAASQPAAIFVSTSLLDMSRLTPEHFGDWEHAAPAPTR